MDFVNYLFGDVIISVVSLGVGFLIGKVGFSTIQSDISEIKGLISGSSKVAVVSAPAPSSTPVA